MDKELGDGQFRATRLWQEVIRQFRAGMPRGKKRLAMRWRSYEDCFSGASALEWLLMHLETTNLFGTVNHAQVEKLLQKFVDNEVIRSVKDGDRLFSESMLYQFVTEPGALNFVEDTPRGISRGIYIDEGLCIANEYAFAQCSNPSFSKPELAQTTAVVASGSQEAMEDRGDRAASLWKEVTLARLLQVVELSTLDDVMSSADVNGDHVSRNAAAVFALQHRKAHNDLAVGLPQWVQLALKCLSEWPRGCTEEFVGGLPVYQGLELDVLQSLITYFSAQPDAIIPNNFSDLLSAIHKLIRLGKPSAIDALQLCMLLLPLRSRTVLYDLLGFLLAAGQNDELVLSNVKSNHNELLDHFCHVILHPKKGKYSQTDIRCTIDYMVHNYHQIFKVPGNLKEEVEKRLHAGQDIAVPTQTYCQRVTLEEYTKQRDTSEEFIVGLLTKIVTNEDMPAKVKKQRLKQFQKAYPDLYRQYHSAPDLLTNLDKIPSSNKPNTVLS